MQAELTFASGTVHVWKAPRLSEFNRFDAFLFERHKKFQLSILKSTSGFERPALCEYLIRAYDSPTDPPVEVKLQFCIQQIPPPDSIESPTVIFRKVTVFKYCPGAHADCVRQ